MDIKDIQAHLELVEAKCKDCAENNDYAGVERHKAYLEGFQQAATMINKMIKMQKAMTTTQAGQA